ERLGRPAVHHGPVVDAHPLARLAKGLLDQRLAREALHHPDGLGALARKHDGSGHVQYSRSTEPQVKPPPTPCISTVSPGFTRPSRTATSRASGIEAADVLAWRSTVTMQRSS